MEVKCWLTKDNYVLCQNQTEDYDNFQLIFFYPLCIISISMKMLNVGRKGRGCIPLREIYPMQLLTRITTVFRHIAVRETGVSRQHIGRIKSHPETPRTITVLSYWEILGAPLIGSPLCQETLVYPTADVFFSFLGGSFPFAVERVVESCSWDANVFYL